jgi:hypothetical protein
MLNYKPLIIATTIAALSVGALADTINFGFEAPDYALGSILTNADGWAPLAEGFGAGTIQNQIFFSGSQAVTMQKPAGSSGTTGAIYTHSDLVTTPENPIASIEWRMILLDGSQRSDVWGVSAMWGPHVERFTLGVDGNNKLMVRNGTIGTVTTSTVVPRTVWHKYQMDLNYQTDKAKVYLDNTFIGEWAMMGGPEEHTNTALFNRFGGNDAAIYDGLIVTAAGAPVPEPATLAIVSLGLVPLLRRRKK